MPRKVLYDPESGLDYATQASFPPELARKLIGMADASHSNIREVLRILVEDAEVDRAGRSIAVEETLKRRAAEAEREVGLF